VALNGQGISLFLQTALDVFRLPGSIVKPMIAASIVPTRSRRPGGDHGVQRRCRDWASTRGAAGLCALRLLRRVDAGAYRHDRLVQRYGSAMISPGGMIYLVAALR
jgi:hypothetical protein